MWVWRIAADAYEYRDADDKLISFEIRNIGRSRAVRFIERALPSATVERQRSDDFAKIKINSRHFIINEPWGDNSRYIIHQQPPEASAELEELRRAFEQYQPSWIFSGDRPFTLVVLAAGILFAVIALTIALLS